MYNYVYFYSRVDKYSMYLLKKIVEHPERHIFNFFCIDGLKKVPEYIQYIPALRVYTDPHNKKFQVFYGSQIEELINTEEQGTQETQELTDEQKLKLRFQKERELIGSNPPPEKMPTKKHKKKDIMKNFEVVSEDQNCSLMNQFQEDDTSRNALLPDDNTFCAFNEIDYDATRPINSNDDNDLPKYNEHSTELLMREKMREREILEKEMEMENRRNQQNRR